jgi:hypothetical protein
MAGSTDVESFSERPKAVEMNSEQFVLEIGVRPMIARSEEAFYRDLPVLLRAHEGEWVAYHGEERLGFGGTQAELYRRCHSVGLRSDEFIVHQVGRWAESDECEASYDV